MSQVQPQGDRTIQHGQIAATSGAQTRVRSQDHSVFVEDAAGCRGDPCGRPPSGQAQGLPLPLNSPGPFPPELNSRRLSQYNAHSTDSA